MMMVMLLNMEVLKLIEVEVINGRVRQKKLTNKKAVRKELV